MTTMPVMPSIAQRWKDVVSVWVATRDMKAVREKMESIKSRPVGLAYCYRFMKLPMIVKEIERQLGVEGYDKVELETDLIKDIRGEKGLKEGQRQSIGILSKIRGYMKESQVNVDMSGGVNIFQSN